MKATKEATEILNQAHLQADKLREDAFRQKQKLEEEAKKEMEALAEERRRLLIKEKNSRKLLLRKNERSWRKKNKESSKPFTSSPRFSQMLVIFKSLIIKWYCSEVQDKARHRF